MELSHRVACPTTSSSSRRIKQHLRQAQQKQEAHPQRCCWHLHLVQLVLLLVLVLRGLPSCWWRPSERATATARAPRWRPEEGWLVQLRWWLLRWAHCERRPVAASARQGGSCAGLQTAHSASACMHGWVSLVSELPATACPMRKGTHPSLLDQLLQCHVGILQYFASEDELHAQGKE